MTNEERRHAPLSDIPAMADEYAARLEPDDEAGRKMIALDCLGFVNELMRRYYLLPKKAVDEMRERMASDMLRTNADNDFGLREAIERLEEMLEHQIE